MLGAWAICSDGVFDRFINLLKNLSLFAGATSRRSPSGQAAGATMRCMKNLWIAFLLCLAGSIAFAQGAPPRGSADEPYTMEYYYKVQWGKQQEFLQLFLKNHYPLLMKGVDSGRIVSVKIETPANHMTEEARWDYRVTLKFRNPTVATTGDTEEGSLIKQLWPDQDKYKKEEQRRFEILLAHWDLPVTDITPKK